MTFFRALLLSSMALVIAACEKPAEPVRVDDASTTPMATGSRYDTYPVQPAPASTTTWTPPASSSDASFPVSSGSSTASDSSTFRPPASDSGASEDLRPSDLAKRYGYNGGGGGGGKSYIVQKGDTLSGIAKKQYGDANQWRRIYEANRDKVKTPRKLMPGTRLTIP